MRNHRWTPAEDATLNRLYHLGTQELRRALPGLSDKQIRGRAHRLGLHIPRMASPLDESRRGKTPIPSHAHPLVRDLIREANKQGAYLHEIAERAGLKRQTISKWRYCVNPHFIGFIAAANALGLDVKLVKARDDLGEW